MAPLLKLTSNDVGCAVHVDELVRLEPVGEGGQEDQLLAREAPVSAVSDERRHNSEQDEETSGVRVSANDAR